MNTNFELKVNIPDALLYKLRLRGISRLLAYVKSPKNTQHEDGHGIFRDVDSATYPAKWWKPILIACIEFKPSTKAKNVIEWVSNFILFRRIEESIWIECFRIRRVSWDRPDGSQSEWMKRPDRGLIDSPNIWKENGAFRNKVSLVNIVRYSTSRQS